MNCRLNLKCLLVIFVAFLSVSCVGGENGFDNCLESGDCSSEITVSLYKGELPKAPNSGFWLSDKGPNKFLIELGPQLITNPQWPNPSIKEVLVSAARTENELAVRLEWKDKTINQTMGNTRLYTDQAAILFPLKNDKEIPPITMGAPGEVVNIWIWKAVKETRMSGDESQVGNPSAIEDLNAEGFSTLTSQESQDVMGQGLRDEGKWEVVFKRPLKNIDENDVQFSGSTPLGIAIWDGGNRETNGQKGIAGWILLKFI